MRSLQSTLAALAGLALLLWAPPAPAAAPILLSGPVTDQVGAVAGEEAEIQDAIADLKADTGIGLYVVYIADFGGYEPQTWADTTAIDSGLGTDDLLLAVATEERRYTWSVASGFPLTDGQLNEVAADRIGPRLAEGDWAGAAIGAAEGYRAASTGERSSGSSGGLSPAWLLVPLLLIAAVLLFLWFRKRRPARAVGAPTTGQRKKLTTEQLNNEANRLLVATDDALRTSEQELGFAEAEFGAEQTAAYTTALTSAKAELSASFTLRQELDDEVPETEPERRQMLSEIIDRLVKANRELDAKAADFDRLRDLGRRAPEAVAALKERGAALRPKLDESRTAVAALRERHPASASATVADFPDTAEDRLRFAQEHLAEAEEAIDAGDRGRAAVLVRAAEEATAQAEQAVEAVQRRAEEIDAAAARLPAVLDEAAANAAEARRLAAATDAGPGVAARAARSEAVVADARRAMSAGSVDPLETIAGVERAQADLDREVQALRDAAQNARRAKEQLGQVLLSARSTTAAVEDYVNTNRGAVGPEARTRLNEAKHHLAQASALQDRDPAQALDLAHRADALANEASAGAQRDVRGYLSPSNPNQGGPAMGGNAGAVLGGILLGNLLGGGSARPGGFSTGSGGHRRGGVPGSFGGGATRGRRGGGGRF
ncbi:TPM domain-containing protein [Glycomyces sp. TRM65418]|uniref:TPM domain-containing protein n=1 Tax=Glycomyces sp. TRM65418 TaxID=2867006 RepID=UPI001CE6F3E8|nr:TPM domain-containing protein [Glycomyces sp. TRM65418]MCC3761886.1 TPM domain-containing protein [Glycomyces sp. TRM65418]QZD55966.1 TPM domain-containing protein [Glycomyces sp. TRM65418]